MIQENCNVDGCRNPNIVGMQREVKIEPSDEQLEKKKIVYKLFCEDHAHLRDENAILVRASSPDDGLVCPGCSCKLGTNNISGQLSEEDFDSILHMFLSNTVPKCEGNSNSNRKRKADSPSTQMKQIKLDNGDFCLLVSGFSKVNATPEEFVSVKKERGSEVSVEDNDCYLTDEELLAAIIGDAELISCNGNKIEPDSLEIGAEYVVAETVDDEDAEEQDSQSPSHIIFAFADAEEVVSHSVDVMTEQDDDNAVPEQKNQNVDREGNSNGVDREGNSNCVDRVMMALIDLTSDD